MEEIKFNESESFRNNFESSKFFKSKIENINFDLKEFDTFFDYFFFQEGEIRVFKDGIPIDSNTYIKPIIKGNYAFRKILKDDLINLLDEGSTIILEALNEKNNFFNKINKAFEEITKSRCWINGYLTPPYSTGFKSHTDPHDVIIIQLLGSKSWTVALNKFVINPFELVYIPKGVFHNATANDNFSFHITIGIDRDTINSVKSHELFQYCSSYRSQIISCFVTLKEIPIVKELDGIIELKFTNHLISFPENYYSFISELINKEVIDINNTDSLLPMKMKENATRILYRKGLLDKKTAPNSDNGFG